MLFLPNKKEFLRIKDNLIQSIQDWNTQFESDKWSVTGGEPESYPCYCQVVPTIKYEQRFHFFYDGKSQ